MQNKHREIDTQIMTILPFSQAHGESKPEIWCRGSRWLASQESSVLRHFEKKKWPNFSLRPLGYK